MTGNKNLVVVNDEKRVALLQKSASVPNFDSFKASLYRIRSDNRSFALISGTNRLFEISDEFTKFLETGSSDQSEKFRSEFDVLRKMGYICRCAGDPQYSLTGLRLHISHSCNLGCAYCNVDKGHYGNVSGDIFMDEKTAKAAINFLVKSSTRKNLTIIFWGGEPLMNHSLIKYVVNYASQFPEFEWKYSVQTNGVLVDEDKACFFARNNFGVTVSIDGLPEIHDKKRKKLDGSGSFNDVCLGVELLHKAGVQNMHISCVLGKEDISGHTQVYEYLKKRFPYALTAIIPEDVIKYDPTTPKLSELFKSALVVDEQLGVKNEATRNWITGFTNRFLVGKPDAFQACVQGLQYLSVTPDGNIELCQHSVMIPDKHFKGGNLNSANLSDINSLTSSYPDKCRNCFAFAFCTQKACHIRRYSFRGDPPPFVCEQTEILFRDVIERISSLQYERLLEKSFRKDETNRLNLVKFLALRNAFRHLKPVSISVCDKCK
ncbi:MAG: radical SAM protein [Planctomycetes bacterium]|nr:radical SAM protein [Planctomycetota bacterium]